MPGPRIIFVQLVFLIMSHLILKSVTSTKLPSGSNLNYLVTTIGFRLISSTALPTSILSHLTEHKPLPLTPSQHWLAPKILFQPKIREASTYYTLTQYSYIHSHICTHMGRKDFVGEKNPYKLRFTEKFSVLCFSVMEWSYI